MVLLLIGLIGVGFQLLFFGSLLLAPIGSLNWPHAISWLLIYSAMAFVSSAFLAFFRPKALEARERLSNACARSSRTTTLRRRAGRRIRTITTWIIWCATRAGS